MSIRIKRLSTDDLDKTLGDILNEERATLGAVRLMLLGEKAGLPEEMAHRIKGALARVRSVMTALQGGYKFDDDKGAQYIMLFAEAYETLRDYYQYLENPDE